MEINILENNEIKKRPIFSHGCFWDMDMEKINYDIDKNFVISRVVSRGSLNDQKELFKYYGWETIKEEVVKIRYLNKKILNYLSIIFEIKKEEFAAYGNRGIF